MLSTDEADGENVVLHGRLLFFVLQEQGLLEGGVVQAVKRFKAKADDEVGRARAKEEVL